MTVQLQMTQGETGKEAPNQADSLKAAEGVDVKLVNAGEVTEVQKGNLEKKTEEPAKKDDKAKAEVPDWVPEKFRNAADPMKAMADAYAELEKKNSGKKEEPKKQEEAPKGEGQEEAAKALDAAGLKIGDFEAEFVEKGELSEDSYAKLAKGGISKEMVDAYIEGIQLRVEKQDAELMAPFGGKENFDAAVAWAAEGGLADEEIEAFNNTMADPKGSMASRKLAMEGLFARFEKAGGQQAEPQLKNGDGGSAPTNTRGFRSLQEQLDAQADPRYAKDEAYRNDVMEKIKHSKW